MRRNFPQIVLLFCITFHSFQVSAQTKPIALKFDEFSESKYNSLESKTISERLKRFAIQLKKEPQVKALIIGYDRRKQYYNNEYQIGDNAILRIQRELEGYGIDEKRIIRLVGGVRENSAYELWLLPKDAEMPKPNPEFTQSDVIYCPDNTSFEAVDYTFDRNKLLEFSAYSNPSKIPGKINYEWEISTGKIVEGQGTEKIKVDVTETTQNYLTVKLNFKGLALECNNQVVKNVTFARFPFKLAEFNGQSEDFKIFPMILLRELSDNPQLQAKIYVYAPREHSSKTLITGIAHAQKIMRFVKFPFEKYPIEFAGYRENLTFEMWLYPKGTEPPQPISTVDEKFIVPTEKITKSKTIKRK